MEFSDLARSLLRHIRRTEFSMFNVQGTQFRGHHYRKILPNCMTMRAVISWHIASIAANTSAASSASDDAWVITLSESPAGL